MQFHHEGFKPGSPFTGQKQPDAPNRSLPEMCDVLIVGAGPAGLTLAAQLSAFPDIKTVVVERKDGPMELGQADGIACRTVEMFNAFGFAEQMMKEAYWVNEVSFWRPSDEGLSRARRVQDTEDGLSEFPHLILNQARIHDYYLDHMRRNQPDLVPYYGLGFSGLERQQDGCSVTLENAERIIHTIGAKYVVGCDGARSQVRKSIGLELKGEAANKAWGVMDILAVTDFPDIRLKAAIQSKDHGNVLIIPREGGYLVRMYVEMDSLAADERVATKNLGLDDLIATAQRILHPFKLDVKDVPWWSIYEIGQRLTDRFDDRATNKEPRVFIAGDACHTHSPKAGQGMNVSMQDAFNLGWKLAAVLRGQMPAKVLETYSDERQAIAQQLIDFDREWAAMMSSGATPEVLQDYFVKHGRYTAGTETRYGAGPFIMSEQPQSLANGFIVGKRFHSAPVIRLADAKPMELGHCFLADGRWRLYLFSDARRENLGTSCEWLANNPTSPIVRFTPKKQSLDTRFDVRAVIQQSHQSVELSDLPALLCPAKGKLGLIDYEKAFAPNLKNGSDIFDLRGIERENGAIVVVRPDQYVSAVLPLNDPEQLSQFFDPILTPPGGPATTLD